MASGQIFALTRFPPATLAATLATFAGTSAPVETFGVEDFDDTTAEYADYIGCARGYGGGGFTIDFKAASAAATSGTYVLRAAFRRIEDDGEDLNTTAFTYDFNSTGAITVPSAAGEVGYDSLTFTDGADSDGVANGEMFLLRIGRNPADANDNLTGDLRHHFPALVLRET
jgi:hypothetical protein